MQVKIHVEGLDRIKKLLQQAPSVTANELSRAVERSVETIGGKARREAPWNKQSGGGTLAQSIKMRMIGRFSGEITAHAPYSVFVHEGTRPSTGRFVPGLGKDKKGRRLINPRLGMHPGQKVNPFMLRAVEKSKDAINKAFDKVIQNVIKRIT